MLRFAALGLVLGIPLSAAAVNVVVDYTYDTNAFFGAGNPQGAQAGAQAKAALEAAASYFSNILDDTFSEIRTPDPFFSQTTSAVWTWEWQATFSHPGTGVLTTLYDPVIPADDFIVYAGGQSITGVTLGFGGTGGTNVSYGGGFTQAEKPQIDQITEDFLDLVNQRGEPDGQFAAWGGAITFDSDASTNWHFNHNTTPSFSQYDFYSVAIHELAHALGFGGNEWAALSSSGQFLGENARDAYGGTYPPTTGGHWLSGTQSTVFGTNTMQETALDPDLTNGQRKHFTTLDAAAFADIGWTVIEPPPVTSLPGDYNQDGSVDAVDYAVWRESLGTGNVVGSLSEWIANFGATLPTAAPAAQRVSAPEPLGGLLALVATGFLAGMRRR